MAVMRWLYGYRSMRIVLGIHWGQSQRRAMDSCCLSGRQVTKRSWSQKEILKEQKKKLWEEWIWSQGTIIFVASLLSHLFILCLVLKRLVKLNGNRIKLKNLSSYSFHIEEVIEGKILLSVLCFWWVMLMHVKCSIKVLLRSLVFSFALYQFITHWMR